MFFGRTSSNLTGSARGVCFERERARLDSQVSPAGPSDQSLQAPLNCWTASKCSTCSRASVSDILGGGGWVINGLGRYGKSLCTDGLCVLSQNWLDEVCVCGGFFHCCFHFSQMQQSGWGKPDGDQMASKPRGRQTFKCPFNMVVPARLVPWETFNVPSAWAVNRLRKKSYKSATKSTQHYLIS